MPGTANSEIVFIAAMMILILVVCAVAIYFFFKTYKKEMRDREQMRAKKKAGMAEKAAESPLPTIKDDTQ